MWLGMMLYQHSGEGGRELGPSLSSLAHSYIIFCQPISILYRYFVVLAALRSALL